MLQQCVNALSGCYLISTRHIWTGQSSIHRVSMPSRAVTSFLRQDFISAVYPGLYVCQCPLGLLPHFYNGASTAPRPVFTVVSMPSRAVTSFLLMKRFYEFFQLVVCQCPLGLLPHFYWERNSRKESVCRFRVNALSGCYLISTL